MRRRGRLAIGVLLLLGALVLQGCGNEMSIDAIEDRLVELANKLESAIETSIESKPGTESGLTEEPETNQNAADEESGEHEEPAKPGKSEPSEEPAKPEKPGEHETPSALHVEGTKLVDSEGHPLQLKGLSTHGLAWFPDYVNEECFREFHEEWGANVIRLALYTAEGGGYCTDGNKETLKKLVRNGVKYATNQNMYVIIDWHILSDNNPNAYLKEAKVFFDEMSKEYQDHTNVIYEICNEPNGGTSWEDIKSYAVQVIETIRANDEDGIILVGTPNWSQFVDQAAADPITGYDNIMYTLHFYAATHTDGLRDTMKSAIDAGLPIFVSEFGICDASGNGAIDEYQAEQWIRLMDEEDVSYVAWNISNKNETSAIFKSSCRKVSGFSENDLSASGRWVYHMLTGSSTELAGDEPEPNSSSESSSTESPAGNTTGNSTTEPDSSVETYFSGDTLSIQVEIKNQWESEGKTYYQYDLILENTSDHDLDGWEIQLSFDGAIALSDGWNGEYRVDGSTLHITCKDYNRSIAAGEEIKEIGFIISGKKDLSVIHF